MRDLTARACLFLSGFAGLVYEVCWIRQGSLTFGSTTLATSTVVAVFFAGLALGSWAFGRWSARLGDPMRWYAAIELLVAALGLGSLVLFRYADALYGAAYRSFADAPALLILARAALVCAVVLPPTVLLGATLPLMCRRAAGGPDGARAAGVLYAVNTLGATLGCLATGLALIPAIGVTASVTLAAAANLVAAALAWTIRSRAAAPAPTAGAVASAAIESQPVVAQATPPRSARRAPSRERGRTSGAAGGSSADSARERGALRAPRLDRGVVAALFFVTGFVALGHEVLWTRFLGLVLRNTVTTYTLSLAVVLAGIVLGSLAASRLARAPLAASRRFATLQALTGLYVLAILLLPPAAWARLGEGPLVFFVLLLPPAVFSGASFPLAVRLVLRERSALGYEVGWLSAVNIAGGIAGSLLVGFLGLPRFGIERTLLATTGLIVAAAVAAWMLASTRATRARDVALAALPVALWIVLPLLLRTRLPQDFLAEGGTLVDFREGLASNVAVIRTPNALQMKIDRWWQGQDRKTHQIVAAHVPMLLHPDPRSVLVVGAGTGQTAERFLFYPIERLEVVDIEPAVFELIRAHFDDGWLADSRAHLIHEDGRNHVAHAARRFDVISLEVGQVFRPGIAAFYTAEFYARARARLAPGGLVCQFVPLPFLTVEQFRGVVGTFLAAFPHATLWYNTAELLLIGSPDRRVTLGAERLRLLAENARVHRDLAYSHWGGPGEWLNRPANLVAAFLCGPESLRGIAAGGPRYSDDRPVLEYATAAATETQAAEVPIAALLRGRLDPFDAVLESPGAIDADSARSLRDANLADVHASALLRRVAPLAAERRTEEALAVARDALGLNSRSVLAHRLMGDALMELRRFPEAEEHYRAALEIDPGNAGALRGYGVWHLAQGRFAEARPLYEKLLALDPADAEAHNHIGIVLANAGDVAAALAHFREALRLRPGFTDAERNLARAEAAAAGARREISRPNARATAPPGRLDAARPTTPPPPSTPP
jgi:spermidine synthase